MQSLRRLLRPQTSLRINQSFLRGNNAWNGDGQYLPKDEHAPPKQEEILREIFDRHYYHFSNKAINADAHPHDDNFIKYRMWQHLYLAPENAFLKNNNVTPMVKLIYFIFPGLVLLYFLKKVPAQNKKKHGRRYLAKHFHVREF